MRVFVLLASASLLAACGGAGGGVSSLGSTPGATSAGTGTGTSSPTPTATPTPAAIPIGTTSPTPAASPTATVLFDVTVPTSYAAVASVQNMQNTSEGQHYAGNASTASAPTGKISYNPRDAVFTIELTDPAAEVTRNVRFQDPAHRTDHNPDYVPDPRIVFLAGFNYLEAADGDGTSAFFYQRPGIRTSYVTLGGFVHFTKPDGLPETTKVEERGVFAFGTPSGASAVPRTGTGRYQGDFLATMAGTDFDRSRNVNTRLQWINGTSTVDVDFARDTVGLAVAGVVSPAYFDGIRIADAGLLIPSGSAFTATGAARIDNAGTFAGKMTAAQFSVAGRTVAVDFAAVSTNSSTAGASSIDGAFYGPDAVEIGGNFRIIGGVPDQRLDIHGAFAGKK